MSGLSDQTDLIPDEIAKVTIAFGDWKPDAPALNSEGSVEALNVVPTEGGYSPFSQLTPSSANVLPDLARGAYAILTDSDVTQLYAGTISGLYTSVGGGFINVLSASVSAESLWKFIRVNNVVVALHPDHVPVKHTIGTTSAAANVGGSPPTAACGGQVGDFLVLGDLLIDPDNSNGRFPSRVRWSGFNNIDLPWISSPTTQADYQDMPPEGGRVVAIAGRTVGTIFQERMISRMTFRGGQSIFDIETIEDKRGAIARDCVIDVGQFNFFIAEDGFFLWNGTNSTPIGDGRVNNYFFDRLQYSERSRISGAADFTNGCVMWAFPTASSGTLDEIMIYSYRQNRWAHAVVTLESLVSSASSNISIDALTGTLESYDISFDDPYFSPGARARLAGFNTQHAYGLFDGPPMNATLDTGEFTGSDGRRVFVNCVRPIVDLGAPSAQVQIVMRDQLIGEAPVFSFEVGQELDGTCPVLGDARYMRFRLLLAAGLSWKHAMGVEVSRRMGGTF